jgi:carbamoyltransferase
MDGCGNDGTFNVYLNDRDGNSKLLSKFDLDLGITYTLFGQYFGDIKLENSFCYDGELSYPGKIMGLASYGKINDDWLGHLKNFYSTKLPLNFSDKISFLSELIGIKFDTNDRLYNQLEYDLAATSQKAFEEVFLEKVKPIFDEYQELPVCFSGGCAMNIILNTRLVEEFGKQVFIGPNPNDSGIALGMMLDYIKPKKQFDATYMGSSLLDIDSLACQLFETDYSVKTLNIKNLASIIVDGAIIGVARGRSEVGLRALGNRSILCNPALSNMKEILNSKVKRREWYRPFAPVVRLQDLNKYFDWEQESRWMSFCPKVKKDYRDKLPAITHVDGTSRVQTVTESQNEFLYKLLTEIEKLTGIGILLNTSFNVDGKPIISTVKDSIELLETSELDGIVLENTMVIK